MNAFQTFNRKSAETRPTSNLKVGQMQLRPAQEKILSSFLIVENVLSSILTCKNVERNDLMRQSPGP